MPACLRAVVCLSLCPLTRHRLAGTRAETWSKVSFPNERHTRTLIYYSLGSSESFIGISFYPKTAFMRRNMTPAILNSARSYRRRLISTLLTPHSRPLVPALAVTPQLAVLLSVDCLWAERNRFLKSNSPSQNIVMRRCYHGWRQTSPQVF